MNKNLFKSGEIIYRFVGSPANPLTDKLVNEFIVFAKKYIYTSGNYDMLTISNIYYTGRTLLDRKLEPNKILGNKDKYMEDIAVLTQDAYKILYPTIKVDYAKKQQKSP